MSGLKFALARYGPFADRLNLTEFRYSYRDRFPQNVGINRKKPGKFAGFRGIDPNFPPSLSLWQSFLPLQLVGIAVGRIPLFFKKADEWSRSLRHPAR